MEIYRFALSIDALLLSSFVAVLGFESEQVWGITDARLVQGTNVNLGEALQFLREYDGEASRICHRVSSARWNYATNMTDLNKRRMIEEQTLQAKFDKLSWKRAVSFDWTRLPDQMVRRQLNHLITDSRASLTDEKYNEIYHLISEMKEIYSHVRVCPYNSPDRLYCDLELDPDVIRIMGNSHNHLELAHIWREWHDKVGPPMKNKFMRYVQIANQAARLSGFLDAGEQMRYAYEDPEFETEIIESWKSLQPLYKELFTYVRRKLLQVYGPGVIRQEGPLPAHILGNLWAQDWSKIIDLVAPYPEYKSIDVTDEMLRQGFTPLRMFQMAEEFYTSLGLKPMPPEFWRFSMFDRPNDRKVQCTASAWDFCNKIDYRIKQCTEVNMEDLISTHHEMAHIQYYLYYAEQPYLFRDGANPGFHEGVANAISLSVFNPVHLHRVGLFNTNTDNYETNINFLMLMALRKVAFAPFALLVDLILNRHEIAQLLSNLTDLVSLTVPEIPMWRYEIFQNGVQNMNAAWWELRLRYQGVIPPIPRTESHFDAAAKRHIPADIPYMKYYIALLLEFQIHNSMCFASGHAGTLHTCDIYRSREAGRVLSDLLKVGKARHWKEVIRMLTRGQSSRLSADAMLQYFQPLLLWLKVQNRNESVVGWMTSLEEEARFQPFLYGKSVYHTINVGFILLMLLIVKLI